MVSKHYVTIAANCKPFEALEKLSHFLMVDVLDLISCQALSSPKPFRKALNLKP